MTFAQKNNIKKWHIWQSIEKKLNCKENNFEKSTCHTIEGVKLLLKGIKWKGFFVIKNCSKMSSLPSQKTTFNNMQKIGFGWTVLSREKSWI